MENNKIKETLVNLLNMPLKSNGEKLDSDAMAKNILPLIKYAENKERERVLLAARSFMSDLKLKVVGESLGMPEEEIRGIIQKYKEQE